MAERQVTNWKGWARGGSRERGPAQAPSHCSFSKSSVTLGWCVSAPPPVHGGVAQWQSRGLISPWSQVRIPPPPPEELARSSQKSRASRALFAREALGVHPYLHSFAMQWVPGVLEEPVAALASPQWSTTSTYLEPVLVPASARFSLCGRHCSPCLYGYAHTRYTPAAAHRSTVSVPREPTA